MQLVLMDSCLPSLTVCLDFFKAVRLLTTASVLLVLLSSSFFHSVKKAGIVFTSEVKATNHETAREHSDDFYSILIVFALVPRRPFAHF